MNSEKKLENLIKTCEESADLGCLESITVWNLLKLMLEGGSDSMSIWSGDIGLLVTDHCVEIAKHNNETGDFTTIAYLGLTIYDQTEVYDR